MPLEVETQEKARADRQETMNCLTKVEDKPNRQTQRDKKENRFVALLPLMILTRTNRSQSKWKNSFNDK
jgi:hypothetical protein